jgi:hypothetical protein
MIIAQIGCFQPQSTPATRWTFHKYRVNDLQTRLFVMDVPFISSGAQSRAHYALVRKVESAASPQQADQYLLAEVKSIQNRISQPGLSIVGSSSIPKT